MRFNGQTRQNLTEVENLFLHRAKALDQQQASHRRPPAPTAHPQPGPSSAQVAPNAATATPHANLVPIATRDDSDADAEGEADLEAAFTTPQAKTSAVPPTRMPTSPTMSPAKVRPLHQPVKTALKQPPIPTAVTSSNPLKRPRMDTPDLSPSAPKTTTPSGRGGKPLPPAYTTSPLAPRTTSKFAPGTTSANQFGSPSKSSYSNTSAASSLAAKLNNPAPLTYDSFWSTHSSSARPYRASTLSTTTTGGVSTPGASTTPAKSGAAVPPALSPAALTPAGLPSPFTRTELVKGGVKPQLPPPPPPPFPPAFAMTRAERVGVQRRPSPTPMPAMKRTRREE